MNVELPLTARHGTPRDAVCSCESATNDDPLAEHHHLMMKISELRRLWTEVAEMGKGPQYEDMATAVDQFRCALECHFNGEEVGGYFGPVLKHHPELAAEAAGLLREHAVLLGRLHELTDRLLGRTQPFEHWDDVRTEMETFLEQLRAHEASETRLLQLAVNTDTGSKD